MSYPHLTGACDEHNDLVVNFGGPRPRIICICGSTRFIGEWNFWRRELTETGHIVLAIEVVTTQTADTDPQHARPELKRVLDELHLRKIDLADEVFILDVGGYIGESTKHEIEYAKAHNKPIYFLSARSTGSTSARHS